MAPPTADMDTLLIGLDAACQPVFDRLRRADARIPTLEDLLEAGVQGPLESQIPPWTPSAWPSLYTGTNPGKHGVFDFLRFEGYEWDVVNASRVAEPPLWELADDEGLTSVVLNVPVTHPPLAFDGALVPGYVAPEEPACTPEGLFDDIRSELGDYRVYPRHTGSEDTSTAEKVENYREVVEMRGAAFEYLADRFAPEFGFLQFQVTDTVFHECPDSDRAVREVYEAVDEQVDRVLDACDPATVVVCSDHGMGRYDGHEFRVNEFLRQEGYLETTRGGEGMPAWDTLRDEQLDGDADGSGGRSALERTMAALAGVGVTSQRVESVLGRVGLAEFVARHAPKGAVRAGTEQVDFARSVAYMRSRTECGVRLNLAGRDPEGQVPESDYERVREELISDLEGVTTPDGRPVFERVAPREEFFAGPYVEEGVDVVTVPREFDEFLTTRLGGLFGPPTEPYNHKRDGILVAAGEAVDSSAPAGDAHLFDVAPTVLSTLGLPAGEQMDGTVLPFVEDRGTRAYPGREERATVATDDDDVEERLANLGYIE